uniref:NAC domain-containing protein n=1 Tax=Nelumbo nucifera TaxID=4432 RepID=A0A822XP90_NELNU|nr:TPA_asm: hypothetical protein HUJ06_022484 [Nelumbo nucifera]
MSVSVNGQSQVPPGFRFHPTEEELLHYYLWKKVTHEKIDFNVIREVDLNKLEPWDIQEKCKIGSSPQDDWYFFSHNHKKYPTGMRTNRATRTGFWKVTGRDKVIYGNSTRIGMRKTLVFYKGRAPNGQKSHWIMHEYRLHDHSIDTNEEGWVVCRVFKQKSPRRNLGSRNNPSVNVHASTCTSNSNMKGRSMEQMMTKINQQESQTDENVNDNATTNSDMRLLRPIEMAINNGFPEELSLTQQLQAPESPVLPSLEEEKTEFDLIQLGGSPQASYQPIRLKTLHLLNDTDPSVTNQDSNNVNMVCRITEPGLSKWAAMDQLIAFHLNGPAETCKQLACFSMAFCSAPDYNLQLPQLHDLNGSTQHTHTSKDPNSDIDLWSFT